MNYILMHKTIPVAELEIDEVTGSIINIGELYSMKHLPIGITLEKGKPDRDDLNKWWIGRSIPASRSGIREALEIMNVAYTQLLITKCLGLSLSDQYWVNPITAPSTWKQVNFFENNFSDDIGNALFGRTSDKPELSFMSPDNTSDGWLKKKWIIADGKRFLVKAGSNPYWQEPLNELLACAIMRRLNIPHIDYTLIWENGYPYSVCEDFITATTELVSAHRIMISQKQNDGVSKYQHYINCCKDLGIEGIKENIDQMLTLDYLIANEDRHFNNFGVIRNADTLNFIGSAPIFDSGTSMWYDSLANNIFGDMDMPCKPFEKMHSQQIKLVGNFDWFERETLYGIEDEWNEILLSSKYIDSVRRDALVDALSKRIYLLEKIAIRN